ncbi:DDE-type integrase/transposase/recombinase [Mycobacterium canetti]|uniref:DDE-type integrase/transposase/recombinase n=1 Tax=Mycobacterium canetti TaxID=78331 RepID=UPI0002A57CC1|nr:DDE-type integrase/transposase/recombinase [Mycobacterium canetti]CCK64237.1 Putative transposase [Mycobacterium canettii CIPT 140070017]
MAVGGDEEKVRAERARAIGLFRYQLIREAADAALSTKERGKMVRELASREHVDPFGRRVRMSRQTIDRWIGDWRAGGFDALVPNPRQCTPRTPVEVLELAVALRRENPQRTAAVIRRILCTQLGWAPDERTLQRNFHRLGLTGAATGSAPAVFGRFEAEHPNDLWTGDALHGIRITVHKTYLFAFLDDHSRLLPGYRWGYAEDTVRLAAALRPALASRGVPKAIYVDCGSAFVDTWLLRACAKLGVRLVHSTPGRPEGRGKIERFFRTVREQFLVEISGEPDTVGRHHVTDLNELNRLFAAWVETVYHRQVHSETGQTPLARWCAAGPVALPAPEALTEAFLWEEHRRVTKTATVSLHGNSYEVDPALVGRKVELVFDPFDLTRIQVRAGGVPMGLAIPHHLGRHAHPKAKPETPSAPPRPSGIDYAQLIETAHAAELARGVNYAALTANTDQIPGQLDLLTGQEAQPK